VWIAWGNGSLHHELHGHDDARARSTFLLQILVLVAMAAFIPEAGGARGAAFAIAAGVLFAILAVLWLLAARGDRPEYRRPSRLYVTLTAATALLLAGTAFLPASARVQAWGLLDAAYLAGYATLTLITPAQASAVLVTDALIDRFGAFTIIVLGETLTGVVAGLTREPISGLTLAVGLVAVVVSFGAWWTYFDFAGRRPPRRTAAASLQWVLGHLPLTAAIAAMGAAMVSLVDHAHDGRTPPATAWLLCAGAAVVMCATMLIAASLQAWHSDRGLYRPLAITCTAVAAACLGVGAARPAPLLLAQRPGKSRETRRCDRDRRSASRGARLPGAVPIRWRAGVAGAHKRGEGAGDPALVAVGWPAPLDREDPVHLGGHQRVDHVGCLGGVETGVEQAPGLQGGNDPGLAGVTLPADLGQQRGRVGVEEGGRREDVLDGGGPVHELPHDPGERRHHLRWVGFVPCGADGGPVGERDGLVVAAEGRVQDRGQQGPLGAEQPVHGR